MLKAFAPWVLSGLLLGLSSPGYDLPALCWVAMIPVFMRLSTLGSTREAFTKGLIFGTTYHYTYLIWYLGLHPAMWIGFSPLESILAALGAWSLASWWGGLFVGLIFAGYHRLYPKLTMGVRLAVFPLLWVLGFQLFRHTDFGVPWAFLEYTQSGNPWIRSLAELLGNRFGLLMGGGVWIAGLIVFHNLLWAEVFLAKQRAQYQLTALSVVKGLAAVSLLPLLLMIPKPSDTASQRLPLPVALIQGNLPIDVVRSTALSKDAAESAYLAPLEQNVFPAGTLVILPEEGAVPTEVSVSAPLSNHYLWRIHNIANRENISVMTGAITYDATTQALYNSMILITPDPKHPVAFYHKRHLVPFGEYTPYMDSTLAEQAMGALGVSYSTPFKTGNEEIGPIVLLTSADGKQSVRLGSLVCLELIYPELSDQYWSKRADILINSSNLGWFHGNRWLEEQFLAIGQMRAAESHLPLIISANTGVSAIIAADGTVLEKTKSSTASILTQLQ